jgi:hypothetical protein
MRNIWALQKEQMVLLKLELQMQYCKCECSCFEFSISCLLGFQDHELMIRFCGLCIQLQDWKRANHCEVDVDKTVVGTTLLGCTNGKLRASVTNPRDCTSSVWDELKFIPIIRSTVGIEVGSILFFSLIYFKVTHKKNLFYCPSISNPNYLPLPHQKP